MTGDDSDALYTVDISSGTVARVGTADGFDAGITDVHGLGWHNGQLYLVGGTASEGDGIYTVGTATGVATRVARMTDLGVGYQPLTAVASHRGMLYATSISQRNRQTVRNRPPSEHRSPARRRRLRQCR